MRVLVLILAFLAVPAVAIAQQASHEASEIPPPRVELQQTTITSPAAADIGGPEGTDVQPVKVEARKTADDAAMQAGDPSTARWWWLVGAIVVAGIVLAALL